MKNHTHKQQAGFSMMEVLFALVLLGMVLVGIALLMTRSLVTASNARYRDIANGLAQEVIELYHRERTLHTWEDFRTAGLGTHCILSSAAHFNDAIHADTNFTGADCTTEGVTINGILFQRKAVAVDNAGKLSVTVTVSWKSGRSDGNGGLAEDEIITKQDFTNWL